MIVTKMTLGKKKKIVCLEDMSLLAMNSLYKKGAMTGTYGSKHKRLMPCATRTIFIFQRENLNYLIACFTQCYCTLVFQHVCFLL